MFNYLKNKYSLNKFRIFVAITYLIGFYGIYRLFIDTSLWWLLAAWILTKFIGVFGHTIALHRYFSHKSFNTTPAKEKFLAWISLFVGVGSPIGFAYNHRHHHRVPDTPADWHSPKILGKLYVTLGLWQFHDLSWYDKKGGGIPRDLIKDATCVFVHTNYYRIWYGLLILTALIDWRISVYIIALPGVFNRIEANITSNCISHSWGYRNFNTPDESRNNLWLRHFVSGEAYHNNHHANPQLYDFGIMPKEHDSSARLIERFFAVDGPQTQNGKIKYER
jgi:stearoyl-CoA desaturase (delta-9 desaturase)